MPRRTHPVLALLTALAAVPALALAPATAAERPDVLQLPGTFSPEGIAGGPGTTFFAGSRPGPAGGAIYKGDLRTGTGSVIVPPTGGASIGMQYDPGAGLLWVAGGATGTVTAYDADGRLVRQYTAPATANPAGRFLNDVDVTADGVFVTDSRNAELVVVRAQGRRLADEVELLPLTGDWDQSASGNNANGIRALPGGDLLVVDMGTLLRVDPDTGVATLLPQTGGPDLTGGDGLELRGNTLYVVYGFGDDSVAVVDLQRGARSYAVTDVLRKPAPVEDDLQRPTTALFALGDLYVVNGKFGVATTDQEVVRLDLP